MASTEAGVDGVTSMDTADDDVHRSDFNAGLQALLEAPRRGGGANNHTTLTAARYTEIVEALRTMRTPGFVDLLQGLPFPHLHPMFVSKIA